MLLIARAYNGCTFKVIGLGYLGVIERKAQMVRVLTFVKHYITDKR